MRTRSEGDLWGSKPKTDVRSAVGEGGTDRVRRGPAFWFATWFGCGLVPKAPGTAGAVGALVVSWPLAFHYGWRPLWFGALALAILWPAIASATAVSIGTGRKDPQIVVVDEVVGQWLTLAGATQLNWKSFL